MSPWWPLLEEREKGRTPLPRFDLFMRRVSGYYLEQFRLVSFHPSGFAESGPTAVRFLLAFGSDEKMDRGPWFRGGPFSKSARRGAPPGLLLRQL
jgi:hypothetical protein